MHKFNIMRIGTLFILLLFVAGMAQAESALLFSDDFEGGASSEWGNEYGSWVTENGVYHSTIDSHAFPNCRSSLPFNLTDFTLYATINPGPDGLRDGGVWLRYQDMPGTSIGCGGLLLVARTGFYGSDIYFHIVTDGSSYSPFYEYKTIQNYSLLRITVEGTLYSVYLDDDTTPVTQLDTTQYSYEDTSTFSQGRVALFANSGQTFDNVMLYSGLAPPPTIHTVHATADQGGSISPSGDISVIAGEPITFSITPDDGYGIADVFVDGASVGNPATYVFDPIEANHTIEAIFVKYPTYTVHATAGQGGSISPSGDISIIAGKSITFVIAPDDGYGIADVLVDGASVGKLETYVFDSLEANHTIEALFIIYPDYFGIQAGNSSAYKLTRARRSKSINQWIQPIDFTTFPEPTYEVIQSDNGLQLTIWYQKTSEWLGMRKQTESTGYTVDFSNPLIMLKNPIVENDQWVSETTISSAGRTANAMIQASVGKKTLLTLPGGTFLAFPISYQMKISGPGVKSSSKWQEWFVPYIWTVMSKGSGGTAVLSQFAVGGGSVTVPPPIITTIDPQSGIYGDKITINGLYFGESMGSNIVRIGETEVAEALSWAENKIEFAIPQGASSGPVVVWRDGWKTNEDNIIHLNLPPEITGVTPAIASPGGLITIQGNNFGQKMGKVTADGIRLQIQKGGWKWNAIRCKLAKKLKAGTHSITVESAYGVETLPDALIVSEQ